LHAARFSILVHGNQWQAAYECGAFFQFFFRHTEIWDIFSPLCQPCARVSNENSLLPVKKGRLRLLPKATTHFAEPESHLDARLPTEFFSKSMFDFVCSAKMSRYFFFEERFFHTFYGATTAWGKPQFHRNIAKPCLSEVSSVIGNHGNSQDLNLFCICRPFLSLMCLLLPHRI
jgi:hypothetical protein